MLSAFMRLIKGSAIYGIGQFLPSLIGFLLIPVYTRFLSTTDYGIVAIATTISSVFAILIGMGLRGSVVRHYFDYEPDSREYREHLGTILLFFLLVGISLTVLAERFGQPVFDFVFSSVAYHPFIVMALWIGMLMAAWELLMGVYIARQQATRYVVLQIGRFLLSLTLILIFVVGYRQGALGKIKGSLYAELSLFVLFLVLITRVASLSLSLQKLKASLKFGLPLVPHLIFSWVLLSSDRIILERLMSLPDVGLYNLGYQIGLIMGMVASSINLAWGPFFFKTATGESDAKKIISGAARWYMVVVSTVAVGLILFSREVILLMAHESYHSACVVVPAVVVGHLFQGLYYVSSAPIFYKKKTSWLPLITGVSAVVNIILNFLWIPAFGILGAAYATAVAFLVQFISSHLIARKLYRIPYQYKKAAIILASLAAVYCCNLFLDLEGLWLPIAVKSGLLFTFIACLVLFGIIRIEDLRRVRSLFKSG